MDRCINHRCIENCDSLRLNGCTEFEDLKDCDCALIANNKSDRMTIEKELKEALKVAALALEIASDWNVGEVQCEPPEEWNLPAHNEDPKKGWCSTYSLAQKLKGLAA